MLKFDWERPQEAAGPSPSLKPVEMGGWSEYRQLQSGKDKIKIHLVNLILSHLCADSLTLLTCGSCHLYRCFGSLKAQVTSPFILLNLYYVFTM